MFRYAQRQYNESLRAMGCIRIGTLHDFRRIEHRRGVGDPSEGTKTVAHFMENYGSDDPSLEDARAMEAIGSVVIGEGVSGVRIIGSKIGKKFDVPDCYVLCASAVCSKSTMEKFQGYDSCARIIDPNYFCHVLTLALNAISPVIFRGAYKVNYQDREERWNSKDWGRHPALIKDMSYYGQEELRAVWQPRVLPIKPEILCDFRLAGSCELVTVV